MSVADTPDVLRDAMAAMLFMQSSQMVMSAYGTLNSSPWTAESFGADERRAAALREYVRHAVVYSMAYATASAMIVSQRRARKWIIIGAMITNGYLVWLYTRASERGRVAGARDWANSPNSRRPDAGDGTGARWARDGAAAPREKKG